MAGHLPIGKAGFARIIEKTPLEQVKKLNYYIPYKMLGYTIKRLPVDKYHMDEEHGKVDEEVLSYQSEDNGQIEYMYEIHLDKDMKINEVYLVM